MRILYASPNLPSPPSSGGAQRTALLLQSLRALGQVDTVFLPAHLPSPSASAELAQDPSCLAIESTHVIEQQTAGHHPLGFLGPDIRTFHQAGRHRWQPFTPLVSKIGDLSTYDLVVSRYLSSACILDLFRHPRVLIDVDDYDPERLRQRLNHASWLKSLTLRRCLRFSEAAHHNHLPKAAHCWISNPSDRHHPGLASATLLPNIPYFPEELPAAPSNHGLHAQAPRFLMVGTLSYSANSDGIDAFLRLAWPKIIARRPDAEFHIVGQSMSAAQKEKWSRHPGVSAIGFVPDLREAYAGCLATLAPILAGGGTNIKVLESAAWHRPAVVTRIAHRGFEDTLPDGEACLREETVENMANACLRLIEDRPRAAKIGQNAAAKIRLHYTETQFRAAVHTGCAQVLSGTKSQSDL
jgi:glycosyltransferase involved in cell wall biosynthesis